MEASLVAQLAAAAPALHLRHLNPHVHGALQGHAGKRRMRMRMRWCCAGRSRSPRN